MEIGLQAPVGFPGWARGGQPAEKATEEKGGGDGKVESLPPGPPQVSAVPPKAAPHLIQQATAATACSAAGTTASPTAASSTTSPPALCRRRRHLVCLSVSLPSYLSEADWLKLTAYRAAKSPSGSVVRGWLTCDGSGSGRGACRDL